MELGKELSRKLFYYLLIFGILFEITLILLISLRFRNPLNKTLDDIIQLAESKIISLNEKINSNSNMLIYKYISDLKLITGHIIHYQMAYNGNSNNTFFSNYINRKKWLFTDDSNYPNVTNTNKYYDEKLKVFNYIDILETKFKNNYDHNEIINTLFDEAEFDLIGFYNYSNFLLSDFEIKLSYFSISILKSIYIRRYILKRNNTDYLRFILTQNNYSFIYPYDRSNNSKAISLFKEKLNLLHEYNTDKCKNYSFSINRNYITFYSYFSNDIIIFCLVNFENAKETTSDKNQAVCSEIDTSKFLNGFFWKNQTEIDLTIVFLNNSEIEPIYHKNSDYYNSIQETFNNEKYGKYKFYSEIKLFHILYYRLFSKYPNLNITNEFLEEINIEYNLIKEKLIEKINEIEESYCDDINNITQIHHISFDVIKTNCYKMPNNHKINCKKDTVKIVVYAFLLETRHLDKNYFIDIEGTNIVYPIFYSISIIESNPNISKKNIFKIMDNKTIKLFFFFVFTLIVSIILIWIIMESINNTLLSSICQIMNGLKNFDEMIEEKKNIDINKILQYENKILIVNKEMEILNNISMNIKKMIILQLVMNYRNENSYQYLNNSRICNIILKMKNSTIKEKYLIVLGYHHFKKKLYKIAEDEYNLVLSNLINKEKKINLNNDNNAESDLKEIIKRFNDITYLNDNSILKGINETILPNIKIKFEKQKIIYLHGMCLYNQAKENLYKVKKSINNNINNISNNIVNNINNINQINNYNKNNINNNFMDALKDFDECRNINKLLGSNPIKEIFSLIMMAKCYIELKEFKLAISSTNEALDLFFELEKIFKDTNNIFYSPSIMMFILNIIFQTIMYTLAQISYYSYKFHSCVYLIFKIFDTSPFVIKNIFYNCSFMLQNIIIRTKFKKNSIIYDNTKKLYSKIFTRLFIRYYNNNLNEINRIKMIYSLSMNKRMSTKTDFIPLGGNKLSLIDTSDQKKGSQKLKFSYSIINNNTCNKLINICVSEKILSQNNGKVLKDVLINYIDECFYDNNDNDKFSYVQFSNNGKKNIFIKPENKEVFIQKLKIDKIDKNKIDECCYNSDNLFNEFYNLIYDFIELTRLNLDDMVSINNKFNSDDNIILMFINTEDIRFKTQDVCKKIVYELNKNNFSLYLISYEEYIKPEKILNIKSFMSGLFDCHFFQIKNYQQIKQIFMNISSKQIHEDICDYNFENIDQFL